jgi:cbb3-type cytochrome oxidase maturation protein
MSVLFIAVPVALLLASSAVIAFFWAARGGQLDDLETPPLRMLLDDDGPGQGSVPSQTAPRQADQARAGTDTAAG